MPGFGNSRFVATEVTQVGRIADDRVTLYCAKRRTC
jgi:hypothetical protein